MKSFDDDDFMPHINGTKVFIRGRLPEQDLIWRSWAERLFSLPWDPRKTHWHRPNAKNATINTRVWRCKEGLSMTAETYRSMRGNTINYMAPGFKKDQDQ